MMKKSALFLAMSAALAAPAFAAEFQVNKDTKFQVNVEVGGYQESIKDKDGNSLKTFTGKGINQIEIKADHVVNSDITVFGEIEVDYDPIGDNGALATDDTRLGINSKSMGRFSIGQFDSYFEDNVLEAFNFAHGEHGNLTEAASGNDGRRVQWIKSLGAVTLGVDLSLANSNDKKATDNALGLTAVYKSGPLTLAAGHTKINKYTSSAVPASDGTLASADTTTAATASYKIGDLTLVGLVAKQDNINNTKVDIMGAGLKYKMGAFDFGVAAQTYELSGAAKRTETVFALGYTPFKNMTVYMDLKKLDDVKKKGDVTEFGVKYAF
jgi:predicted porin